MAVLKKEELMEKIKNILGDRTDDDALAFVEDVKDTFEDKEKGTSNNEDWKAKYEENDKKWREKYRDRFFKSSGDDDVGNIEDDIQPKEPQEKLLTYDNLFKEEDSNASKEN